MERAGLSEAQVIEPNAVETQPATSHIVPSAPVRDEKANDISEK
jgi:hypothetical protein